MKLKNQANQVEAMKILLKNYEEKGKLNSCPLCKAAYNPSVEMYCKDCVWVVETNNDCISIMFTYSKDLYPIDFRNNKHEEWRQRRIKELKHWIKKYEVE